MSNETKLQNKIKKYLESKDAYVLKYHGSNLSVTGVPDLIGSYEGLFFGIEVKLDHQGKHKLSKAQLFELYKIKEHYGLAMIVDTNDWKEKIEFFIETFSKYSLTPMPNFRNSKEITLYKFYQKYPLPPEDFGADIQEDE